MSEIRIQEAKNGAAQLSKGKYFLMVNKFLIKKGSKTGQALMVVRMSHLEEQKGTTTGTTVQSVFVEDVSFLLSQKQFDSWLALLIQVSERQLKEGEKVGTETGQTKL
jgi:hypothetical protein